MVVLLEKNYCGRLLIQIIVEIPKIQSRETVSEVSAFWHLSIKALKIMNSSGFYKSDLTTTNLDGRQYHLCQVHEKITLWMPKLPPDRYPHRYQVSGAPLEVGLCLQTLRLMSLSVFPRDNVVWSSTIGPHRSLQCPPSKLCPCCFFVLSGAPEIICKVADNFFSLHVLCLLSRQGLESSIYCILHLTKDVNSVVAFLSKVLFKKPFSGRASFYFCSYDPLINPLCPLDLRNKVLWSSEAHFTYNNAPYSTTTQTVLRECKQKEAEGFIFIFQRTFGFCMYPGFPPLPSTITHFQPLECTSEQNLV